MTTQAQRQIRAETLSTKSGYTFGYGDPVMFKVGPLDHMRPGTVVGKTYDAPQRTRYDVRGDDGEFYANVAYVELDEEKMTVIRTSEALAS